MTPETMNEMAADPPQATFFLLSTSHTPLLRSEKPSLLLLGSEVSGVE